MQWEKEFKILRMTTEQYIACERAAKQLQDGEVPMKNFPISMKPAFRSIGVAFSDQENPGESIFKDADKALCHVKENGRNGCAFYNGASSMGSIEGIEKDLKEKDTEK